MADSAEGEMPLLRPPKIEPSSPLLFSIQMTQSPSLSVSPGRYPTTQQCSPSGTVKVKYQPKSSCPGSSSVFTPLARSCWISHLHVSSPKQQGLMKYSFSSEVLKARV